MKNSLDVPLKGRVTAISFSPFKEVLEEKKDNRIIIADRNTAPLLPHYAKADIVIESGEKEKNLENVERILKKAFSLSLSRDSYFIAFGGGVILDLVSFAASVYMRGANLILIPTTLLAMVDATLGGKTGIDYEGWKNSVGTFYPASDVVIDTKVLSSLPEREWKSGMGEVLKHALLSQSEDLYNFLLENRGEIMRRELKSTALMISKSLSVKISFVISDPEEILGIRSALNLGHTFAHALETVSSFSVSHGEAVAWGCVKALEMGSSLGITERDFAKKAVNLFSLFNFDSGAKIKKDDIPLFLSAIAKDKKKRGGEVRFVLMEGQGKYVLKAVKEKDIIKAVT